MNPHRGGFDNQEDEEFDEEKSLMDLTHNEDDGDEDLEKIVVGQKMHQVSLPAGSDISS